MNFDGQGPIYQQIADKIRQDILSGALSEEEQVMSTTQYATTYRINPATAAKAYTQLVNEGIIYKKRGIGMFVSPNARQKLRAEKRQRFYDDMVRPLIEQARLLDVPLKEIIEHLHEVEKTTEKEKA